MRRTTGSRLVMVMVSRRDGYLPTGWIDFLKTAGMEGTGGIYVVGKEEI